MKPSYAEAVTFEVPNDPLDAYGGYLLGELAFGLTIATLLIDITLFFNMIVNTCSCPINIMSILQFNFYVSTCLFQDQDYIC